METRRAARRRSPPSHHAALPDIRSATIVEREAGGEERAARPVERRPVGRGARVHAARHQHQQQRDGDDRQVGREHRAPPESLGQLAADQRADGRRQPHARAEESEHPRAPIGRRLIPQDRHRRRHGGGAAGGHQDARHAEHVHLADEQPEHAARRHERQAHDERAAVADEIAQLAARDSGARCS